MYSLAYLSSFIFPFPNRSLVEKVARTSKNFKEKLLEFEGGCSVPLNQATEFVNKR